MKNTKYMMSNGIAFSEKKDLKQLRKYAAKGWIVKRFKFMGYELEVGSPENVMFSLDIRELKEGELEEYIDMFSSAGWEYVCSEFNTHLFKAPPGTTPIYTDTESNQDKMKRLSWSVVPVAMLSIILLVVSYVLKDISTGVVNQVFQVIFIASIAFAIPMIMTLLSTYYRYYRTKSEC